MKPRVRNVEVRTLPNGRVLAGPKVRAVPNAKTEALDGARGSIGGAYVFEVPGPPRGKGRPRFGRTRQGAPVAYTDAQTVAFENLVAMAARLALPKSRLEGPISVAIALYLPRTQTRVQAPATVKPDLDNCAKAVLDGLKAHFHDQQVTVLVVTKERAGEGEQPRTLVRVEERLAL